MDQEIAQFCAENYSAEESVTLLLNFMTDEQKAAVLEAIADYMA